MSVFENFVADKDGNIINTNWVEWDHFLVVNKPEWLRKIIRGLMALKGHCMTCTSLDGCYFMESKMPEQPQHKNCDCKKKSVSIAIVNLKASAEMPISKLINYVFDEENNKGKKAIFESWGYSSQDSSTLKSSFEEQALKEYLTGKYILKNLDKFGQRIAIPINLKGNMFNSGWIVEPDGKIKNTTPFGGRIK